MFPQYFGNAMTQGEQSQGNPMRRQDQGYRQEAPRQQPLQNPYATVNMNAAIAGQQFDTRYVGSVNPVMNPNVGMPFGMVSNSYGDTMKAMPIPYDRSVVNYGVPMQVVSLQPGMYGNINPYYAYYGYRQGMPMAPMERTIIPGYGGEYPAQMMQEKVPQVVQPATQQAKQQPTSAPLPVKQETSQENKGENYSSSIQGVVSTPPEGSTKEASATSQPHEESAQTTTQKENPGMIDDIHLANMLLQIKGKTKETPSQNTTIPQHVNEVAMNQLPPNRVTTHSAPALVKPEDKRAHLSEVPYELPAYNLMYPAYSVPQMTFPAKQTYTQMYPIAANRYAYPYQPQQSISTPQPQPIQQPVQQPQSQQPQQPQQSQQSQQPQSQQRPSQHPPIPSPAPAFKNSSPIFVGDYYVFCTVCRHGTAISLDKKLPEMFQCANCGFTGPLDKHLLLSYYNFSLPGEKTGGEDTQARGYEEIKQENTGEVNLVKNDLIEPVQVKPEAVNVTEGVNSVQVKNEPIQVKNEPIQVKNEPIVLEDSVQVKEELVEQNQPVQSMEQSNQPVQSMEQGQSTEPVEQPNQPVQSMEQPPEPAEPNQPVADQEIQEVASQQDQPSLLPIDSVVLSSVKDVVTPATLKELSLRDAYSINESNSQQMNNQIEIWKQECLKVPKEWWIDKFVKMEIPESLLTDDDLIVNKEINEDGEKKMIIGEIIAITEVGFVIRLVEQQEEDNTITVPNIISGNFKCWLLFKEGYLNLLVCDNTTK